MKKIIVSLYSFTHFIVDLACAILVTNLISQKIGNYTYSYFWGAIIYNFCGFALQFPIGTIADKINKNAIISCIGCLIVAIAYLFSEFTITACIIAGIGNSLFHVGGGIDVLNISNKKASLSGIFVSTGAMGIFLGTKSSQIGFDKYYIVICTLIICAFLLLLLYSKIKDKVSNLEETVLTLGTNEIIAVICLIFTVCVRSYVGMILAFEWKSSFILALISIFAVVFGKMLGGIIGDKIGFKKISIISLGVSSILFIFAFKNSIIGVLAILLFNMTMPITLTALSNIMLNNKGMAFGLLTLALFIGSVPTFFGYNKLAFTPAGLFIITIISTVVLYIGINNYHKFEERKEK